MRRTVAVSAAAPAFLFAIHVWIVSGVSAFAAIRGVVAFGALGLFAAIVGSAVMRDRDRGAIVGLFLSIVLILGGRPGVLPLLSIPIALLILERHGPWHLTLDWSFVARVLRRGVAVAALAVAIEAVALGRIGDLVADLQHEGPLRSTPASGPATPNAPDIVVILLDDYARADVMAEFFDHDDSAFLDGLTQRGFDVATENHSNYLVTNLSVPSFLGYAPIEEIPALRPAIAGTTPVVPTLRAANEARGIEQLRQRGYEIVGISSGFEQVALRRADRFIDGGQLDDYEIELLRWGVPGAVVETVVPQVIPGLQRDRIESVFGAVEALAAKPDGRPRFVFAHVPSPHGPWVHGPNGEPRVYQHLFEFYWDSTATTGLPTAAVVEGYRDEATYLGTRTLRTVDAILAGARPDSIIVVMSDHGSSFEVSAETAERRLRNLFAARTPGHLGLIPNDITLMQVLPTLFNAYFDAGLVVPPGTLYTDGPGGLYDPVAIPGSTR